MENFDKYIKTELSDYEVEPPAGFWHNISEQLNKEEAVTVSPARKGSAFFLLLRIAAIFLGVVFIGDKFQSSSNTSRIPTAKFQPEDLTQGIATPFTNLETHQSSTKIIRAKVIKETTSPNTYLVANSEDVSNHRENDIVVPEKEEVTVTNEEVKADTNEDFVINDKSIPVYSLKLISKEVPENDEFSVIEPKSKDAQKKVIVIEKGISKKPSLDVRIPYRF